MRGIYHVCQLVFFNLPAVQSLCVFDLDIPQFRLHTNLYR